jgi:hypothetical protein
LRLGAAPRDCKSHLRERLFTIGDCAISAGMRPVSVAHDRHDTTVEAAMRRRRYRFLVALVAALALNGCVFVPPGYYYANGYYYFHPGGYYPVPYPDPSAYAPPAYPAGAVPR